jgi:protein phosphatase 1 regulatory subunit 3A/B/C/D/E
MHSVREVYEEANYEEPNFELFLPRNLSYGEESVLDNYSVSSDFAASRNRTPEKTSAFATKTKYVYKILKNTMSGFRDCVTLNGGTDFEDEADDSLKGKQCFHENETKFNSNDSDFIEEGVFVNMIDEFLDLDDNCKSNESDDYYADSINSPADDADNLLEGHEALEGESVNNQTMQTNSFCKSKKCIDGKFIPHLKIDDKPFNIDNVLELGSQKSISELIADDETVEYEESEFNFCKSELRKSSSLKSNKTPPGTPSRKKMVRFADAMGLDLEDVRHVLNLDAPPKIPASAMSDLKAGLDEDRKHIGNRYLAPCFAQPGACDDFLKSVISTKVRLENAVITQMTITGFVRVANIGFHKFVRIRYTTNSWGTFHDISASYIQNSCDGPTDRFSFSIVAPDSIGIHSKLEFAVSYTVNNSTYWDSNFGYNYVFECFAKTTPTENEDSWVHFV